MIDMSERSITYVQAFIEAVKLEMEAAQLAMLLDGRVVVGRARVEGSGGHVRRACAPSSGSVHPT